MKSSDTMLWAIILVLLVVCALQNLGRQAALERVAQMEGFREDADRLRTVVRGQQDRVREMETEQAELVAKTEKWRKQARELERVNSQLREDLRRSATQLRELTAELDALRPKPAAP